MRWCGGDTDDGGRSKLLGVIYDGCGCGRVSEAGCDRVLVCCSVTIVRRRRCTTVAGTRLTAASAASRSTGTRNTSECVDANGRPPVVCSRPLPPSLTSLVAFLHRLLALTVLSPVAG